MNYLVVIYFGDEIHETEIALGQTITVGTGRGDTICLEERASGLTSSHITLSVVDSGVQLSSVTRLKCGGEESNIHILTADRRLNITKNLSVAIYARRAGNKPFALSGQNEITIGRNALCDICLCGQTVSSYHAVLRTAGDTWEIFDQNSKHGTYVNGKRAATEVLRDHSVIFIRGWQIAYRNNTLHFENMPGEVIFKPVPEETITYPFIRRGLRVKPKPETAEIEILSPPNIDAKPNIVSWLLELRQLLVLAGVIVTMMVAPRLITQDTFMITVLTALVGAVVCLLAYKVQMKKWSESSMLARMKYADYLAETEKEIISAETKYIESLIFVNPDADECISIAARRDSRLWVRAVTDDDFLAVRAGTGIVISNVSIKMPKKIIMLEENPLFIEAEETEARHKFINNIPVTVHLSRTVAGIGGNREAVQKTALQILIGVAAHHSYEDVKIAVIYPENEKHLWDWVRWLPHVRDGENRFIACTKDDAACLLYALNGVLEARAGDMPRYFILFADKTLAENADVKLLPDAAARGFTVMYAYGGETKALPRECTTVIECGENECAVYNNAGDKAKFTCEEISVGQTDSFARSIAPVRLMTADTAELPQIPKFFTVTVMDVSGNFETDAEIPSQLPFSAFKEKLLKSIMYNRAYKGWEDYRLIFKNRALDANDTLENIGAFDGSRLVAERIRPVIL